MKGRNARDDVVASCIVAPCTTSFEVKETFVLLIKASTLSFKASTNFIG